MRACAIRASSYVHRRAGPTFCVCVLALLSVAPSPAESLAPTTPFAARFQSADVHAAQQGATKEDDAGILAEEAPPPSIQTPQSAPAAPPSDGHATYRTLVETEARRAALAPEIAEAVMAVESGYNPGAIGGAGEIGLMQILPSTARMLGFSGTQSELAVPATNIHYGVLYLAEAWRLAGGDLCTAVMKYRAGHGETRFSHRSVDYCIAVRGKLLARGFPVSGSVPVATFGEPGGGGTGSCRKCVGRVGNVNLAALNTRLNTLVLQVRGGR
jgi:hypothetical protein